MKLGKIVKGIWRCLLSVCLLCMVVPMAAVHADVLIELDDSFWEKNYRILDNAYRRYTVNSPEGYAYLWESPVSSKQEEVLANGTEISGSWLYTDDQGEVWCAIPSGEYNLQGNEKVRGWIKTSECLPVPDYISFFEAYSEEFIEYDPSYDHAFDDVENVTLWAYPCSGVVVADQVSADWFPRNGESPGMYFDSCWRDPQGRMWAFVNYCYGIRNTWLCLDDPSGEKLLGTGPDHTDDSGELDLAKDEVVYPAAELPEGERPQDTAGENVEEATEISPENTTDKSDENILPQNDAVVYPPAEKLPMVKNGVTGLAVAGVLAVAAVTVLLIWFFFVRGKKNKD